MTMRALKAMDYGGHRYQPGDQFEPCSDADRHVLSVAQLAAEVESNTPSPRKPKKDKHNYKTSVLRAEDAE